MAPAPTQYIDEQTEAAREARLQRTSYRNPQTAAARAGLDPFHGAVFGRVRAQNFRARPSQPWYRLHPQDRAIVDYSTGARVAEEDLPPADDGLQAVPRESEGSGWGWDAQQNTQWSSWTVQNQRDAATRVARESAATADATAESAATAARNAVGSGWDRTGEPIPEHPGWGAEPGTGGWSQWRDSFVRTYRARDDPAAENDDDMPRLEPAPRLPAADAPANTDSALERDDAVLRIDGPFAPARAGAVAAAPVAAAPVAAAPVAAAPVAAAEAGAPVRQADRPPRTTRIPAWGQRYESRDEFRDRVKAEYIVAQEACATTNKDCRPRYPCEDCIKLAGEEFFAAQERCAKTNKRCERRSPCLHCLDHVSLEFELAVAACAKTNKNCRRAFPCDNCLKLPGAGWCLAGEAFIDEFVDDADTDCGSVNGHTPPSTPNLSHKTLQRELDVFMWYRRQEREVGERYPMFS